MRDGRASALAILLALTLALASPVAAQEPAGAPQQTVVEVRIHGNYETPDEEVLAAAGIALGDRIDAAELAAIARRLDAAGFRGIEILQRYRSLTATDEVVLIISLRERLSSASKFLFLPEIHYTEDEKFSIGGRVSTKSLFGGGELISVPVTIGGVDRAALEVTRNWDSGIGVGGRFEYRHYNNPHFDVGDERLIGAAYVEKAFSRAVRFRVHGGWEDIDFGGVRDELLRYGAQLSFDTRPSRSFAYDSVLARAAWQGIDTDSAGVVNRISLELAAYKTLLGPVVLAVRGLYENADAALPAYERPYVGGMVSLRGTRAGTYSGDGQALGTVELRIPLTSMSGLGRAGFTAFWDVAAVWDHGSSPSRAPTHHGVGGGVFLQVPFVDLNIDVGTDLKGSTRVHFGLGYRF
jgi:outer membrane protein assembly factor BamA